jgi:hypothetical protein
MTARTLGDAYAQMYALLRSAHEDPEKTAAILAETGEMIVARQLDTERLDLAARAAAAKLTENATLALSTLMLAVRVAAGKLAGPVAEGDQARAAQVVAAAKLFEAVRIAAAKLSVDAQEAAELVKATADLAAEALKASSATA